MDIPGDKGGLLTSNDLLKQFRVGDFASFTKIYEQHIHTLLSYGKKITPDEEQVKDAIHDLFTDLWRRRDKLDHIVHIEFYLLKSLRYMLVRANRQSPLYKTIKDESTQEDVSLGIDELINQKESIEITAQLLQKAIEQLPHRQREVIYLRFYKGYNNHQVAEILNMHYQSASNLLQRAIDTLKKHIPGYHSLETFPALFFLSINFF